jgi:replicative DNA helicase
MTATAYEFAPPQDTEVGERRVPPHSVDAEGSVLSACLADERALMRALEVITADDFYRERHRRIFRAMIGLAERGAKIDPVTLCDALERSGELESSGGRNYVYIDLDGAIPTAANVEHHAAIVREKAALRRLIERSDAAVTAAYEGRLAASAIAAELQRDVLPFSTDQRVGFVRVKEDLWSVMEEIENAQAGQRSVRVVPTGYLEIDSNTCGGFERGHFVVLAGVPGSAKTGAALNIALSVARAEDPVGVLFVTAEMTRRQLIKRSLANLSQVELSRIRQGAMRDDDFPRLARGSGYFATLPLWLDETPTPDIASIVAKCRAKKAEHPEIGLIVVDFIQLVQRQQEARRMRDDNRSAELTNISYTLGGLAKELDVVTIATSQVDGAAIEKRNDKRPQLGDARWSQGMREAAHLMATVYRPAMYDGSLPDTIELAFQKGRDDPPFSATFDWVGKHMLMRSRIGHERTRVQQEELV